MCGIGGILRTDGQPIPEAWLDAIDARIAYRGPDGHGRFRDRVEIADPSAPGGKRVVEVAFVHRRLSIIDHTDGHQPMVSERGRNESEGLVAVVFNGCIYNHRELRKELEGRGHRFITDHSDTEVLIHGWREWGEDLSQRLEGMYAFALWDRARCTAVLSRDLFGEKPLYWAMLRSGASFAFASDARAIHDSMPECTGAWFTDGNRWLHDYLRFGYSPAGQIFFHQDFRPPSGAKVEPGCLHVWRPQHARRIQTSDQSRSSQIAGLGSLERLLEQAVVRRLEADVPLGCFLSGGIDSSLVALFAARSHPSIKTFTVRMPDDRFDESEYAQAVADRLGTQHLTLDAAANPSDDLCTLIEILGQPLGDSSILPTYWVSKAARQHAKVALAGDGGDELFVGYQRYLAARSLKRFHRILAMLPNTKLLRAHPKSLLNKAGRLADAAKDFPFIGVQALESIFNRTDALGLLEHDEAPKPGQLFYTYSQSQQASRGYGSDSEEVGEGGDEPQDALAALRMFDVRHYLPNDLLTKVDTASMACGLEVRCPFLDRDLARAALSMPIDQLMPGGQRKGLLRQIARKYLPKEIVDRPKMGFAIPIGEWFRDDDLPAKGGGMKTLLLDHLNSAEPFGSIQLNKKAVQRFIDEHMSGKRDHGQRLFTLLTLSIWARQMGRTAPSSPAMPG